MDLGLSNAAFIEECPHVRGGLDERFHCSSDRLIYTTGTPIVELVRILELCLLQRKCVNWYVHVHMDKIA